MVPMSAGAGIGKVGRFQEQGNWYTGGVPRNLFFVWLYNVENPLRAQLPVITQEIGDTWIHGVGTDPKKVAQYRELLRWRAQAS